MLLCKMTHEDEPKECMINHNTYNNLLPPGNYQPSTTYLKGWLLCFVS